jgi:hypothetical protein
MKDIIKLQKILEDFKDNKDLELTKTKLKELPKEIIELYNKQMKINNLDNYTI